MPVRLFVGNLPYDATEPELREHFGVVGPLSSVFIPVDRETGRPRGFAFVEFADAAHGQEAVARLNSQPFKGRNLSVSEARARESRPGGPPPPRSDRPPRAYNPSGGYSPAAPPLGETRPRREFGPDQPKRGKGKALKTRREDKPTGPIPVRGGGRIYDVEDLEDEGDELPFDPFAKAEDEDKADDLPSGAAAQSQGDDEDDADR
jgi:RNA recognition motif-containing protein